MPGTGFDRRIERRHYRALAKGIGALPEIAVENGAPGSRDHRGSDEKMFRVVSGLSIVGP